MKNIKAIGGEFGYSAFDLNFGGEVAEVRDVIALIENFSRKADEARLRFYLLSGKVVLAESLDALGTFTIVDIKEWRD